MPPSRQAADGCATRKTSRGDDTMVRTFPVGTLRLRAGPGQGLGRPSPFRATGRLRPGRCQGRGSRVPPLCSLWPGMVTRFRRWFPARTRRPGSPTTRRGRRPSVGGPRSPRSRDPDVRPSRARTSSSPARAAAIRTAGGLGRRRAKGGRTPPRRIARHSHRAPCLRAPFRPRGGSGPELSPLTRSLVDRSTSRGRRHRCRPREAIAAEPSTVCARETGEPSGCSSTDRASPSRSSRAEGCHRAMTGHTDFHVSCPSCHRARPLRALLDARLGICRRFNGAGVTASPCAVQLLRSSSRLIEGHYSPGGEPACPQPADLASVFRWSPCRPTRRPREAPSSKHALLDRVDLLQIRRSLRSSTDPAGEEPLMFVAQANARPEEFARRTRVRLPALARSRFRVSAPARRRRAV